MRLKEGNKEKDIIEAAVKVFAKEGYHTAKITTIARKAKVSTGSVYLYYKGKEEILLEIFRRLWKELTTSTQLLVQRTDLDAVQKVDGIIELIFSLFEKNPSLAIVFVNEQNHLVHRGSYDFTALYEKYLDLAQDVMAEGIRKRQLDPSLDLTVVRHFAFGGIRNLIHQWAHDPKQFPLDSVKRSVQSILKNGILSHR